MASKRSVGFAVVMSLVLCGGVIWLVVSVRMEENDKTAQAETYEYNGWTYYVYDDPIPLRIEDLINPICLCLHVCNILSGIGYLFRLAQKSKKAADDVIFVDTPSAIKFQEPILVILLIGAVYWLANLFAADDPLYIWVAVVMMAGMFSIMFLVNGIKQWLKKATASRGMNKFLTLLACFLLPTILTSIIIYAGIR